MSPVCVCACVYSLFMFADVPVCLLVHVAVVFFFLPICVFACGILFSLCMCVWVPHIVCVCAHVSLCDTSTGWTPECPQWQRGMADCPNQQPTANTECSQFVWLSVLSHWHKHTHTDTWKTNVHAPTVCCMCKYSTWNPLLYCLSHIQYAHQTTLQCCSCFCVLYHWLDPYRLDHATKVLYKPKENIKNIWKGNIIIDITVIMDDCPFI